MPFEKNQDCCHGNQIGYQNRMIQAILNFHVAPIPSTKLRFNLTYGWEKMVFERYQNGYNGSHIIYSNGTGIAFMNVHVVFDSNRFISFLHLTPRVSPFSLLRFPKVDNVSKILLMGIKDHQNTIKMRAWL